MPDSTDRPVRFQSRFANHRLVMDQKDYNWKGNRIQGETPGHTITFENHMYLTERQDEIEFLRSKLIDGDLYEIPESVPDPSSVLVELATATLPRTQEILALELEGYGRSAILQACQDKLEYVADPDPDPAPFGYKEDGTPKKAPGRPKVAR